MRNISIPLVLILSLFPLSDVSGSVGSSRLVLSEGQKNLVVILGKLGLLPSVLNPIIAQYAVAVRPSQIVPYIDINDGDYQRRTEDDDKFPVAYIGKGKEYTNLPLCLRFFPGDDVQFPESWYPEQVSADIHALHMPVYGKVLTNDLFFGAARFESNCHCRLFPRISHATMHVFYVLSCSNIKILDGTSQDAQVARGTSAIYSIFH